MKIEILPTTTTEIPLAILSMSNLDNRELNPAIEKQLAAQGLAVAQPQNALADLLQVIHARHPVQINAWDMNTLGTEQVQLHLTAQGPVFQRMLPPQSGLIWIVKAVAF
ncbi:hypothetical protein TUA1478L_20590 [Lactiplantibacillus plantarum]